MSSPTDIFEAVPLTEPRRCRCDANPLLLQRCRGARHTPRVNYQGDPVYPVVAEDLRTESRIFVGGSGFFLRPDHVFRYPRLSKQFPHRDRKSGTAAAFPTAARQHRHGPDLPVYPRGIPAPLDSIVTGLRVRALIERRRHRGGKHDDRLQPRCGATAEPDIAPPTAATAATRQEATRTRSAPRSPLQATPFDCIATHVRVRLGRPGKTAG